MLSALQLQRLDTDTSVCRDVAEMRLHPGDVWGHIAPLFHLVDVFAVYAITLLGGRHVLLPTFNAADVLLAIGE